MTKSKLFFNGHKMKNEHNSKYSSTKPIKNSHKVKGGVKHITTMPKHWCSSVGSFLVGLEKIMKIFIKILIESWLLITFGAVM